MSIEIRRAIVEDAEIVSYLGTTTFDQAFGDFFKDKEGLREYLDTTFSVEKIKNSLKKDTNKYWVVTDQDQSIGYAKLQLNSPSEFIKGNNVCKLQKIYFLNTFSAKGIGSKLQQLIFEEAIANYCDFMWLSVLKENDRAVKFYERNDYKIVGEHPFMIGNDRFNFWVMSKKLGTS
ncbi:GNAT family N-acetyltransferase [Aquimarina sp. 2201CG5-10]|uniref:GNAT family N-acetyltransferase n=1 Tax=Aquimarina callyspongiae TaxID=3098150 RepID=UPI002AB3712A|nr:GNAT family N-acetyltransferase [Aquimarina sp. 2201CG5-10]MDY8135704.1 GNAT family N-acetyltransferase [Aquimarina sp. 2201CG5-10]